jgi:hypothetical protein
VNAPEAELAADAAPLTAAGVNEPAAELPADAVPATGAGRKAPAAELAEDAVPASWAGWNAPDAELLEVAAPAAAAGVRVTVPDAVLPADAVPASGAGVNEPDALEVDGAVPTAAQMVPGTAAIHTPQYPSPVMLIFWVHVRLRPDVSDRAIVEHMHDTHATSSDPAGGVNDAVVPMIALVDDTAAGPDASSVMVPFGLTSNRTAPPSTQFDDVPPRVVAPGVPVADVALQIAAVAPADRAVDATSSVVLAAALIVVSSSSAP